MPTPVSAKQLYSYSYILKLFQLFTQYMSVSHGHSTMGGIEGGKRQKEGESLISTRQINGLWRCPSIDINVSE